MHGWAAMLTGTLCAHISAHTSITASIREKLKCSRCLCFSCRNGFSLFFSFRPHVPSRCWKGLGQQESMAQKTPHVSTSQWQITVPSPEQHIFLRQFALFFSLIWKRGDWLLRGKSSRRLVSESRYRHTRLRPMSNAALCITADMPTCSSSTRAQAQKLTPAVKLQTRTNTFTKRNHKWLDSILQRSLGALVLNARVKKRSTETTVLVSACSTDLLWPPVHSNLHLNMGSALNEKVSGWCLQKKKKSFVLHALSIPHSYTVSRGSRDSLITHTHALLPHLSCSITCYVICAKHIGYILGLCLYDTRILKASKHEYNVASNSVEAGFSGQIRSIYSKVALKQTGLI